MISADNLTTLFEFLPIGVYRSAPDGRQVYANPALARLNGYDTAAQLVSAATDIGNVWYVDPLRRSEFVAVLERDGRVVAFESEVRRYKSRERIWVREHAHVVRDAQGRALYFEGTVEDITVERAQQRAVQASRDELEQMVQIIPAVVYRLLIHSDGRRRFGFMSQQIEPMLGISPAQAMAEPDLVPSLRHPDDADRVAAAAAQAVRDGTPLQIEYRLCLPSGEVRSMQMFSAGLAPVDGWAVRVGMIFDITERRRVEEALRTSGEVWKRALLSMGDGVWDWYVQDGMEFLSAGGKALLGYGPDELADTPQALDDLTHPEDRARMLTDRQRHLDGLTPSYVNEHRIRSKGGEWVTVLSRGVILQRDAQGRALRMIGMLTDVSQARQADTLRLERDRAAAADLSKSQFLSRVSHELRTPLNAILGFAQLLELDTGLQERQRGWVRHVLDSGRHLLALVDDVLDLSSVQTGQLPFVIESVALWSLVDEVSTMLAASAVPTAVTLHTEPAERDPALRVLADRRRLKQILSNLVSNAIKYNRPAGWVRVSVLRHQGVAEINVVDSGPGMNEAQMARLFNPFERVGAQHGSIAGTGLGLALCRQLAEAMGGAIGVSSAPGEGARFSLRLPQDVAAGAGRLPMSSRT